MEEMSEKKVVRFKIEKGGFGSLKEALSFLKTEPGISFKTNGADPEIWESIIVIVSTFQANEMEKILKDKRMFVDRSMPQPHAIVNA